MGSFYFTAMQQLEVLRVIVYKYCRLNVNLINYH